MQPQRQEGSERKPEPKQGYQPSPQSDMQPQNSLNAEMQALMATRQAAAPPHRTTTPAVAARFLDATATLTVSTIPPTSTSLLVEYVIKSDNPDLWRVAHENKAELNAKIAQFVRETSNGQFKAKIHNMREGSLILTAVIAPAAEFLTGMMVGVIILGLVGLVLIILGIVAVVAAQFGITVGTILSGLATAFGIFAQYSEYKKAARILAQDGSEIAAKLKKPIEDFIRGMG